MTRTSSDANQCVLELEGGLALFQIGSEEECERERTRLSGQAGRTYLGDYRILVSGLEFFMLRKRGVPCAILGFLGPDLCRVEYSWEIEPTFGASGRVGVDPKNVNDINRSARSLPVPPEWLERAVRRAAAVLAVRFLLHGSWSRDCTVADGAHYLADGTELHVRNGVLDNEEGPAVRRPDGSVAFYRNGLKSRRKGAAVIAADGSRAYLLDGDLHRTTGAAIEAASGHREFWRGGVAHRKNRPAIIYADGSVQYIENGMTGRKRAPAIIRSDGTRKHLREGILHNEAGPAIRQGLKRREWWTDGHNLEDETRSIYCGQDEVDARIRRRAFMDTLFVSEIFPGSLLWYQQAQAAKPRSDARGNCAAPGCE